ncbi:UNVERIFIED_CONTAM: hypothetical protein Slati_2714000 [Sesamum latifolium]|uniref:Reverse transcriptase zinc-binding domain-containing protein n=1 Tax=Sesamum latifolium TaxID=2727402 RepID=A0AAW2VW39_9LAMI
MQTTPVWRTELVRQVFDEDDARMVLSIPLAQLNSPDTLLWHYNNKGEFSVQSAYRLALQHARQQLPSTLNIHNKEDGAGVAVGWRFIWNSRVPPKVQTFVWRACHEAMPTTLNLAQRAPSVDIRCIMCGVTDESLHHVLLQCSFTRQVSGLSNLQWHIINRDYGSVHQWMLYTYNALQGCLGDQFLAVCWSIWRNRCAKVMEGGGQSPLGVASQAVHMHIEYMDSWKRMQLRGYGQQVVREEYV